MVQSQINVRQGLRLDALRRVDDQDRAVAGRQAPRDLIVKVDMAGGVDQVKDVLLPVLRAVDRAHRLRLDRNAALALQIHIVQDLVLHLAARQQAGLLDDAVGQRGFTVIDMGNDAKIADVILRDIHRNAKSSFTLD